MPVNTTQTKYFSNIGPGGDAISWGNLASTLGNYRTSGGVPETIRISSYIRKEGANEVFADVNATLADKLAATAIIPDCYENRTSGVDGQGIANSATAGANLKISSFKNVIKRWDASYTGNSNSQINLSPGGGIITDPNYAYNADLNVPKKIIMDGSTLKASTVNEHAVVFSSSALNLDLTFNGTQVLGREGTGGSGQTNNSAATNGSSGGGALYLRNTTSRTSGNASTINLNLSNTALIAGGGGGGAGGPLGNVSGSTICSNYYIYTSRYDYDWWFTCPSSCAAGETQNACGVGNPEAPNSYSVSFFRGQRRQGTWYYTPWYLTCSGGFTYDYGQATRSAGGTGGVGQGSNNVNGPGGGGSGGGATSLNCPGGTYSQNSTSNASVGGSGAAGGTFGATGGNTSVANGGAPGPWLNVSNTRWANKGSSGVVVQRINVA